MYKTVRGITVVFFFFILWIIYLADSGKENILFQTIRTIPGADKWGHFGLYGLLTFLLLIGSRFKTGAVAGIRLSWGVAAVTLFALAEEVSQIFIATRTPDVLDLAADALGIALAVVLARATCRCISRPHHG
ncbi:VanZ family protein [uncultured Vibrio sp.]|uniref:VanZ family protein n=1 Tax=uncultured Vibrio sp. TaxID=114054 RepID=UPI002AA8222E|nr:VanZ family protein [uncultured Vibrio sp.]